MNSEDQTESTAKRRNLDPSDSQLHQVQEREGYCRKHASSFMDSGVVNSVAPRKEIKIDFLRLNMEDFFFYMIDLFIEDPEPGPEDFQSLACRQRVRHPPRLVQIADISRPLTSVGPSAEAGKVVAFVRTSSCLLNVGSGSDLEFQKRAWVILLRGWIQERAKRGFWLAPCRGAGSFSLCTATNSGSSIAEDQIASERARRRVRSRTQCPNVSSTPLGTR